MGTSSFLTIQKPRRVSRPQARKPWNPFFPAACTSGKTLYAERVSHSRCAAMRHGAQRNTFKKRLCLFLRNYDSPRQRTTRFSTRDTKPTVIMAVADSSTMGANTPAPSSWVIMRREK